MDSDTILNQPYNHNHILSPDLGQISRYSTITFYSTKSKHKHFRKQKSSVGTKPHSTFQFCLRKQTP